MNKDTNKKNGIPVKTEIRDGKEWVDGRSLHETLGLGRDFCSWIKARIKSYGLIEGKDYVVYYGPRGMHPGVNPREYLLSPDSVQKLTAVYDSRKYLGAAQISTFRFDRATLNVFRHNGELWFFGVDVCELLKTSGRGFSSIAEEGQMIVVTHIAPRFMPGPYVVISEWALLWHVYRSKTGEAMDVSKWLVNEVLPHIRKAYAVPSSFVDRFRQFFKFLCKEPKFPPSSDRPGFPLELPEKGADHE